MHTCSSSLLRAGWFFRYFTKAGKVFHAALDAVHNETEQVIAMQILTMIALQLAEKLSQICR